MNGSERAKAMLVDGIAGYKFRADWTGRVERLATVLAEHPDARIEVCRNERTGHRFGNRKCRAGRCSKIGSTSTDGQGSGYQLWAVWA